MLKRAQGRPSRAAGVVGRQKIVEDIREALRADAGLEDTSRKRLALAIGVTPALITYYFPEQNILFEQLAVPVIENHRMALSGIVNRTDRIETKLKDIIGVLHVLYGKDRRLYEIYRKLEDQYPDDYAETATMTSILSSFFCGPDDRSQTPSFEAIVLQGAVRRMCEFAEQVKRSTTETAATKQPDETPTWLVAMLSLFARSSGPSLSKLVPC